MECLLWTLVAVTMATQTSAQLQAGCYLEPIRGNATGFANKYSGVEMNCPPGTVFDALLCTCVHGKNTAKLSLHPTNLIKGAIRDRNSSTLNKGCGPRFSMDFNSKRLKNKVRRYNIGGGETLDLYKGFAHFTPVSSAIFWTFKYRPFGDTLQIQMRFKDDPTSKLQYQVLLTNCEAMDQPGAPSLLIFLDKSKQNPGKIDMIRVHMRTYAMPQGVEVAVPFRSGEFNVLVVLLVMDRLTVRVDYEDGTRLVESNALLGDVIISNDYLRLGSCPDQYNGFVGEMDWFDYFPCWPKK